LRRPTWVQPTGKKLLAQGATASVQAEMPMPIGGWFSVKLDQEKCQRARGLQQLLLFKASKASR